MITAAMLCDCAAAAYVKPATWAVDDVHGVRTDFDDNQTAVAFRGTVPDDVADWLRDLNILPTYRRGIGLCHWGFMAGAESVYDAIRRDVAGRRVVLTGHSLGGALAIDLGALMARDGWTPEMVVTFGAPRVGLWGMRRLYRKIPSFHYIDADDPVPNVPLPWLHMRPTIPIGVNMWDLLAAHDLARYRAVLGDVAGAN